MSRHRTLSTELGMALAVANLVAWGAWCWVRPPYTESACAVLGARRTERDLALAASSPFPAAYVGSDHLVFGRPLHALTAEPLPLQVLYVANALPLVGAWSFVVPSQSNTLGPTCSESRTCGVLFLILSFGQWAVLGGAFGYWISSRRF